MTLKMEAAGILKMWAVVYQTTWCYEPENTIEIFATMNTSEFHLYKLLSYFIILIFMEEAFAFFFTVKTLRQQISIKNFPCLCTSEILVELVKQETEWSVIG
jgi:hypothetical protein